MNSVEGAAWVFLVALNVRRNEKGVVKQMFGKDIGMAQPSGQMPGAILQDSGRITLKAFQRSSGLLFLPKAQHGSALGIEPFKRRDFRYPRTSVCYPCTQNTTTSAPHALILNFSDTLYTAPVEPSTAGAITTNPPEDTSRQLWHQSCSTISSGTELWHDQRAMAEPS